MKDKPHKKGSHACGNCGEYGHNRKTCPKTAAPFKPEKVDKNGKRERRCSQCGKPGHMRRNCEESSNAQPQDTEAMSERQFESVTTAREHQMQSREIAEEFDMPLREVNAAFASATYNGYLERRRRA